MSRLCGASLGEIVNEPTFRDVCTKSGKWFRGPENCFVGPPATKQAGMKFQQFQWSGKSEARAWLGNDFDSGDLSHPAHPKVLVFAADLMVGFRGDGA
jgi:hypothetical protein